MRAAGPAGSRTVLVVDAPPLNPDLIAMIGRVFSAGLVGLLLWLLIVVRMADKQWASVTGATVAALTILAAVGDGAIRLDTLVSPVVALSTTLNVELESWGTWGYPLAALPLLPLMGFAYAGFVNRSQPSPHRLAYAYVLPAVLGLTILVLIPFLFGIVLAFLKYNEGSFTWVGLTNFINILASSDYPITHPLNFLFYPGVYHFVDRR